MQKLKVPRYIQWISLTGLIFLFIMTLMRLALMIGFHIPINSADVLPSFVLGLRFDLRIICITALIVFLLGSIGFLHPLNKKSGKRLSFTLWIVFIILLLFFYTIDFTNYAYLSQRMNASLLNYLEDAGISFKMMWQSYPLLWMIIGIVVAAFLFIWIVRSTYNYILSKPMVATRKNRIIWGIVFFLLLGIGIFGKFDQYPLRWSDAYSLRSDYAANLALNPFQSFFSSLKFRRSSFDINKVKEGYGWMSSYLGVDHADSSNLSYVRTYPAKNTNAPQNVVLVICESFSGYKSSMYGNPLNTTPYFASLTKQGLFFDRCYTPHYGTARGVWATVTGVPDVSLTRTASRNPAAVDQRTIINDFAGSDKFYFIGGSTSWANIRGLLINNIEGLHLYEQDDYSASKEDVWGISDKELFLEANKVLSKQQKPFFAIIQTAGNHRPYTIPEEDKKEFAIKKIAEKELKQYGFTSEDEYNAFRYTDFAFKKFMEAAAREKYFENTLFVFIGDHGIRGDAGNMFPRSWTEQGLTTVHVPLLFYSPKYVQAKTSSLPASQVDVLPTIAGICGIPYTNTALGKDLTTAPADKAAFIFDPDIEQIGVVDTMYYYNYSLKTKQEAFVSIKDDRKIKVGRATLDRYRAITNAFYESSRYLLLNNKKKK